MPLADATPAIRERTQGYISFLIECGVFSAARTGEGESCHEGQRDEFEGRHLSRTLSWLRGKERAVRVDANVFTRRRDETHESLSFNAGELIGSTASRRAVPQRQLTSRAALTGAVVLLEKMTSP